jgi:flagellar protein FliS
MLYDGTLKFLEQAKRAMAAHNLEQQNQSIQRAQKIILELLSCLDMDKGGDIAKNLFGLYSYALSELVEANMKDDPEGIERAMTVFSELRKSWDQLESGRRHSALELPNAA